ncbi:NADPH-dependent F420 reductase [Agrobacterium pusense]|uniref:NADPH-dependent F420 reductase n=1 Tax=Agrobacterium pusense TaxID=648995 RepID=UPI003FD06FB5
MKIAVLGTGMVGRALAERIGGLGHSVVIGTRDVAATMARIEAGPMGIVPFQEWHKEHPDIALVPFSAVGLHADLILNATYGAVSLAALEAVGREGLAGKVLVDLALPLDFSDGMPPKLLIANTDSLGEQIQRTYPETKVVKTLNTVFFKVMVEPDRIPGRHNLFIAGDDADAKSLVRNLLAEFGWAQDSVIDLGGIQGARAAEMYMQLYFTLAHRLDTFDFNIAVVTA